MKPKSNYVEKSKGGQEIAPPLFTPFVFTLSRYHVITKYPLLTLPYLKQWLENTILYSPEWLVFPAGRPSQSSSVKMPTTFLLSWHIEL